jgi:hypothetical protein
LQKYWFESPWPCRETKAAKMAAKTEIKVDASGRSRWYPRGPTGRGGVFPALGSGASAR